MFDAAGDILQSLLRDAVQSEVFIAARGNSKSTSNRPDQASNSDRASAANLADGVAVVTFLLEQEAVDLGDYVSWNRLGIAFKNTYGESGFKPWLAFSEAAAGFDSEESCRRAWDAIGLRNEGERLTIATYIAQATRLGWKPPRGAGKKAEGGSADAEDNGRRGGPGKNVDPAAFTLDLVDDAGDELWLDQEDKPHVTYVTKLPGGEEVKRHAPIDSGAYKGVLAHRFHEAAGTKADSAAALLEYRARDAGVHHVAALRVGQREGRIYVDLGTADGSAVEIDGNGWHIVTDVPIRFTRGNRGELPAPERGGAIADFERHFNLNPDDLKRLLGYMIGAFNVGASYAILMTDGEQGSGKSTLNDKVVGLLDPPRQTKSARMSFSPKEQDLHIGALGVHVPYFDNVSTFSADAADALCRMSTGGGSGARKLYTDDGYSQMIVIRPIILTCIGSPSTRPDLLDRSVRITAQPLTNRRTERAVISAYNADRAKMLGFLFDCVSAALRNRQAVEDAVERGDFQLPRMADFGEFVEGAGEMLELQLGGFSALLKEGQSAMQVEAVHGHPIGAGLVAYFSTKNATPLNASARDILSTLKGISHAEYKWPAANVFGKSLKRLSVGLRHLGIEWKATDPEGHANVAKYKIWVTAQFEPQQQTAADEIDSGGGHF
jgi:hypothetical protein